MIYKPANLLVTGGAGFIGANFVNFILGKYSKVNIVNLDKLTYAGSKENINKVLEDRRHKFIEADIADQAQVEFLLEEYNIDTIVHFAAESHVDRSISGPSEFIHTNIFGTYCLLQAAKKIWLDKKGYDKKQCLFHHISTDEVYGSLTKSEPAFKETNPYQPNSPYSASKAGSDHLVRAYHHTYGLPVTTSNCSNNYGPMQHDEKLIPTIIRKCMLNQPIPIYGDGSNIRDWLFVLDHCEAIEKIIVNGVRGETYNIGGNEEHNNLEIAKIICHELAHAQGVDPNRFLQLIAFVSDRPGHDWRYSINAEKIARELKWQPSYTFHQGIRKTIQWYLQNRY